MTFFGRRTWVVVAVGVVAASTVLLARPMLKRRVLLASMGAGRSPSVGAMDAFVGTYGSPEEGLEVLWASGGVNQRDYVIEYLHRGFVAGSETWKRFRPWIVASLSFPDEGLRQDAFLLLEKNRDAAVGELALPMLRDADPESRITALHALAAADDGKYLPAAGGLLEDAEASVRAVAAGTVFKLAKLKSEPGETVEEGAEKWWAGHRGEMVGVKEAAQPGGEFPVAPALHVVDLEGKVVDLEALRGKVVVLNFWATWCGPCVEELPTLQAVAAKHSRDVVVVGIAIDTAPDDDGDAPEVTPAQAVEKIEALRKQNGVTYRMALDGDGRAMNGFGGEAVPASILIDRTGHVRRRLIGLRSEKAWDEMIAELRGK